jgi:hypothetical protein
MRVKHFLWLGFLIPALALGQAYTGGGNAYVPGITSGNGNFGTSGYCFVGNGSTTLPTFQACPGGTATSVPSGTPTNMAAGVVTSTGSVLTSTQSPTVTGTVTAGGVAVTADGVHAGEVSLTGNTTAPTIPSNSFGWVAPSSASFTSYFLQPTATAPAANQVLVQSAPSAGISTGTWKNLYGTIVSSTVLTANSANISQTSLYTTPAVNGYYMLCTELTITRAATTSSTTPIIQPIYNSAVDGASKFLNSGMPALGTNNATFYSSAACETLYVAGSSTISFQATNYASVGATSMQYSLAITIASQNVSGL